MIDGCLVMRNSEVSANTGALNASATTITANQRANHDWLRRSILFLPISSIDSSCCVSFFVVLLTPLAIARQCVRVRRIRSGQWPATGDFLQNERLEPLLLRRVACDFDGQVNRHDD